MAVAKAAQIRIGKTMEWVCRWLAYFGGAVLASVALVTVFSIIGRALLSFGLSPIKGDFEIVEMGCAIAVFSFLPWCQLKRGHVTVDIFISRLSDRKQAILGFIGDVLLALAAYIIFWRMWLGFGEKFPFGSDGVRAVFGMGTKPFFPESTYELELPLWIPYAMSLVGAALFFIVAMFTVWRSLNWVLDGKEERV